MFRSILCPLDFSTHSERALDYAIKLSRLTKAHITIVHVIESLLAHSQGGVAAVYNLAEFIGQKRQALELWATMIAKIVGP